MGKIDPHDGVAVALHGVELRPCLRAAGAGHVLDHDRNAGVFLPDGLLEPRSDVGFAARVERNDVVDGLVRIVVRSRLGCGERSHGKYRGN